MNYIVLNGVNSNTIGGLLVQSLPPIVKPKMRTKHETIDGRDGDLVTKLGYESYSKEISIALHGNYKIDDVIEFFNSEGDVIFSNESDKYYRYTIVDEINFERLMRYRTATVAMHVQPYKFSAVEDSVAIDATDKTNVDILNRGNVFSRPTLAITANGNVIVSVNGIQVLAIDFGGTNATVRVDLEDMNAYKEGLLYNRSVTGDYENITLNVGANNIAWTGNVSAIVIERPSRWI